MSFIRKILSDIPFLRHCTDTEISHLHKIGRISRIKRDQIFDLKKTRSLNVVINGIFEIEVFGKKEIVYLPPGSYFGSIPFTDNRQSGSIKAVKDSTLLIFNEEDIYKFFIGTWKGARGYIKAIDKMGFRISTSAGRFFNEMSRVISIYSIYNKCGKTLLSALMGLSLSDHGKSIILDLSYTGESVFDFFDKKITSPLSQKQVDNPSAKIIDEKIERVNDNLDLINISFGSKVKVNPEIISPVLFALSGRYRYILVDLSDYDHALRDEMLKLSDKIFCIVDRPKDYNSIYNLFDSNCSAGQRVYYVKNEFFSGKQHKVEGGLIFEKFNIDRDRGVSEIIKFLNDSGGMSEYISLITEKKRAIVCETNLIESVVFAGFFKALDKRDINIDFLYSSSFSYILITLYLLSRDDAGFVKKVKDLYSEERINTLLNIVFPENYVFKKNNIAKYFSEICSNTRIEKFKSLPVVLLSRSEQGGRKIFSTGYMKQLAGASFLMHPVFESEKINNIEFNSGYPSKRVKVEDLFRADIDEIFYVSINNREKLKFREKRLLNFFRSYIELFDNDQILEKGTELADKNLSIEVSEKDMKIDRIIENSEKNSIKLLNDNDIK